MQNVIFLHLGCRTSLDKIQDSELSHNLRQAKAGLRSQGSQPYNLQLQGRQPCNILVGYEIDIFWQLNNMMKIVIYLEECTFLTSINTIVLHQTSMVSPRPIDCTWSPQTKNQPLKVMIQQVTPRPNKCTQLNLQLTRKFSFYDGLCQGPKDSLGHNQKQAVAELGQAQPQLGQLQISKFVRKCKKF